MASVYIQSLADYYTSSQIYNLFSTTYLQSQIQIGLSSTVTPAQIQAQISRVVRPLNFGNVTHLPHTYVNGNGGPGNSGPYPTSRNGLTVQTPLNGFSIGVAPASGQPALRRAVITAGMHSREMAPPLAVARFFSQLIVNYIQSLLTPSLPGFPLVHPAFKYQAGKHHVLDENGNDITSRTYHTDQHIRNKESLSDASISPTENEGIILDDFTISPGDQKSIIENLEIIVLPICNPSGLDFVLTQIPNEPVDENQIRIFWRKNRVPIDTYPTVDNSGNTTGVAGGSPGPSVNAITKTLLNPHPSLLPVGVDINRNADFAFNYRTYYLRDAYRKKRHGATDNPFDYESFNGSTVNSEVESQAIMTALLATRATLDANQGNTALVTPTNRNNMYNGFLFYLDIHSCSQSVYIPWGTDTISNVGYSGDPTNASSPDDRELQSEQNSYFDTKRDGVFRLKWKDRATPLLNDAVVNAANDTYREFFPKSLQFAGPTRTFDLVVDHLTKFGSPMVQAIHNATVGLVPAADKARMLRRCDYAVKQSLDLYTVSGSPNDFIFKQNILAQDIQPPLLQTLQSGVFQNTQRTGPVISLCIEVGHLEDGGFMPIDQQTLQSTTQFRDADYYSRNQYQKVEREAFAALHSFLMSSILYA